MTRAVEEQRRHDEDTRQCVEKLKDIGRTYGRMITQAVISAELSADKIDEGVDAAIDDVRAFLQINGICDLDVESSVSVVRQALIAEGKATAILLHEHGVTFQ